MTEKEFLAEAIPLLENVEQSGEWLAWCRKYSVYAPDTDSTGRAGKIYDMMQKAYRMGLVITDYASVIKDRKLGEKEIQMAKWSWVLNLDRKCTLAAIAWHFRRDYFCEGSLIRQSVADGALLQLFRHLQDLDGGAACDG